MALLIVDLDKRIGDAKGWRDAFAEQLPDLEIRIWPDPGELAEIEYLAFMRPDADKWFDTPADRRRAAPNCKLLTHGRLLLGRSLI